MISDTLTQLKNILSPLNIYDLSGESLISAELSSYAVGINLVKTQMNELLSEGFVETASDFGLAKWEELLGLSQKELEVYQRRQNIINRLILIRGEWDLIRVIKILNSAGFAGGIFEPASNQTAQLYFKDTQNTTLPILSKVLTAARIYMPAQLKISSNISPLSWNTINAENYIFAYWDSLNLTFDILNN